MLGVGGILTVRDVPELDGSILVSCDEEVSAAPGGVGLHIASINGPLLQGQQVVLRVSACVHVCVCLLTFMRAGWVTLFWRDPAFSTSCHMSGRTSE